MSFDYKKQADEFYKEKLSTQAYDVCRREGTERPGSGEYDKFYEKGTYYCAGCGGDYPLFKSGTKFDSGTGWPSFWDPIGEGHVVLTAESSGFPWGGRIEVSCGRCKSHLGHVFDDGPRAHTGKRYCINSVALIFVPEGEMPQRTYDVEETKS
ncbi:MAG: peptide-methionine (R)-S-oxide reductase MsrB [Janthinobacterium lividum]